MNSKTVEAISNILSEILNHLHFPFTKVEVIEEKEGIVRVNIETEQVPFLIGIHGERINALQHILKNILWNKKIGEGIFVIIDVDNYKKSREEKIIRIAEEKANAARTMQIPQIMPPLDPYLRKLVHTHFNAEAFKDITTESIGEGRDRRLQIICI